MRIGVDATALYGRYGGVEYSLWNLLYALRAVDLDNQYVIYVPADGPPAELTRSFPATRWRWVRLPFRGREKTQRILWQQFKLPLRLRQDGCDLLHAPTYVSPLLHTALNRVQASIPTVLTVYDLIALDEPQFATPLNRLHYRALLGASIRGASCVVVPSVSVRDAITRRFSHTALKTRVVPLGLEPQFFQEPDKERQHEVRSRYNLPEQFLLFAGNFEPKKNLDNVLAALHSLPVTPPLVVAGGARAWAQLPASRRIQPIGYVARRDLPALYQMCTAFLFPSLAEGFGLPVLEALACGAPVITSDRVPLPGLEEVALLCDPLEPASIAARIEKVLGDEALRRRLAEAGRNYARPYTWRVTTEKTLEIYQSLGGRHRPPP